MKYNKSKLIAVLIAVAIISSSVMFAGAAKPEPNPSADLDQIRNGKASSPDDPGVWVNGNLNPQQSHYIEGYSVPYRVVMEDLPTGTSITLRIGFDIKKNDNHALDYLTTYDYIDDPSHVAVYGHAAETINPLADVTGVSGTNTTYLIPTPSSTGSPVPGQPTTSFNSLALADKQMTLYGGIITNVAYYDQGDLTLATDEAQVDITFTADSSTAVLSWGGHIASVQDWGFDGDSPRSASGISGSPYHTSLVWWSLDEIGQQDRSLKIDPVGGIIVKKVIDWGIQSQYQNGWDFTFTPSWGDDFVLGDGESESFGLIPGTYIVTESDMKGWALDKIIIEGGGYDTEIPGPTAEVVLETGKTITITFVNKPPDFVIPENPLGTLGSMIALLGGALLVFKRESIGNIKITV